MNGIVEFLKSLGAARLGAMAAVTLTLVGFFAFLIVRLSAPQMAPLFSGLSLEDSSAIVTQLESMNVPYQMRNDGATILVPKSQSLRLRMRLAEDGLPVGGSVGYELFDKTGALGTTNFVQNINHLRALEGELARTIRALDRVKMARVHLVLPKKQLFARQKTEPSASIVLKMRGGLNPGQIKAIQHLTSSAVEGLKPTHVSIVDESGKLLASGSEGDNSEGSFALNTLEERRIGFQHRLKAKVGDLVTSIVGPGNARVEVSAELDFKQITETSSLYDPESQVVRSTRTKEETSASKNKNTDGTVSVGNELPNANADSKTGNASSEDANSTEETVNYEISHVKKVLVTPPGRIKRLSVAVLVDGILSQNDKGDVIYKPRTKEQIDQIATLVRSAVGFDRERGDTVEVVNLRFAPESKPAPLDNAEAPFLDLTKDDYFYIAQIVGLFLIALLVLLLIIRPLVNRIVTPDTAALETGAPGQTQLTGPDGVHAGSEAGEAGMPALPSPNARSHVAEMIEGATVAGEIQGNSVRKVGELVQNNPHEAASIIRQWMNEPA
ncbi:MAG: flagellar M-ring protein FliF [Hyphomicrobiales bacterium]|nr:MAG: flagellar M-ring protein FliF [Hyphomicrobiales bacterium]